MLKATEEEIENVREYFEWQAPDLEVTFMQKVYSEAVGNTRHDVWDIHEPLLSGAIPKYGPCPDLPYWPDPPRPPHGRTT
jgi:hypothetical protein